MRAFYNGSEYYFSNNPNLEFFYIPEVITTIQKNGIAHSDRIKYIYFPKSLNSISSNSLSLPSLKMVFYQKWQYELLLNAGIPKRALNPFQSCSLCETRNNYAVLLLIFLL